jgi:hypothetical protein
MTKNQAMQALKRHDISISEVGKVYKTLVREAKAMWKEDCIMDKDEGSLPYLRVQLGYNREVGLLSRVGWKYSNMNGEKPEWYKAIKIDLTEKHTATPMLPCNCLGFDPYYQRTGKVSQVAKTMVAREYPFENYIKSFEQVVMELLNYLG